MIISITGTPGSGKTTIASCLRDNGEYVIDLNQYIEENGLKGHFDEERDSYSVDTDKLNTSLKDSVSTEGDVFIDGHLSHFLDCDMIIVIRCDPEVLNERLSKRDYSHEKIIENVQAEAVDVILCESLDSDAQVFEIDNTSCTPEQAASVIKDIAAGRNEMYRPGNINWWGKEMLKWF